MHYHQRRLVIVHSFWSLSSRSLSSNVFHSIQCLPLHESTCYRVSSPRTWMGSPRRNALSPLTKHTCKSSLLEKAHRNGTHTVGLWLCNVGIGQHQCTSMVSCTGASNGTWWTLSSFLVCCYSIPFTNI